MSVTIVSKETQRVLDFQIDTLNLADCYQAVNVRDKASWNLVQSDVPEKQAVDWMRGNDLALDSIR